MESLVSAEHILIIDDDERLTDLTREYLESNGFRVTFEHDGANAVNRILEEKPDLVILDIMLPGEDGISICRRVRPDYHGIILMMTARSEEMDQVLGLEMGADDYIKKPVPPRVLLARLHALLRGVDRIEKADASTHYKRLVFDNLVVDGISREAWLDNRRIDLTSVEFDLLWLLSVNAGRVLSRDEIFSQLRGTDYDGQDRSIDVCISRIRAKIGDATHHPYRIKTVRSRGYVLVGHSGAGVSEKPRPAQAASLPPTAS